MSGVIKLMISFLIIFIFLICSGIGFSWNILFLPLIMVVQYTLQLGILLTTCSINAYIRDAEYDAIMEVAFDALEYNDTVMINAPFKKEIRSLEWMANLRERLSKLNAELCLIWVNTDIEVVHHALFALEMGDEHGADTQGDDHAKRDTHILERVFEGIGT